MLSDSNFMVNVRNEAIMVYELNICFNQNLKKKKK